MTAPQQPAVAPPQPAPAPPGPQVTDTRPPAPVVPEAQGVWPPDDETLMQLQMNARFSIIDEPVDDSSRSVGADQQGQEQSSAGTQPPPQPERQG